MVSVRELDLMPFLMRAHSRRRRGMKWRVDPEGDGCHSCRWFHLSKRLNIRQERVGSAIAVAFDYTIRILAVVSDEQPELIIGEEKLLSVG